jgi:hypothetical protein
MSEDEGATPEPSPEPAPASPNDSPFTMPQLEEIGKSFDPPGIERRDE